VGINIFRMAIPVHPTRFLPPTQAMAITQQRANGIEHEETLAHLEETGYLYVCRFKEKYVTRAADRVAAFCETIYVPFNDYWTLFYVSRDFSNSGQGEIMAGFKDRNDWLMFKLLFEH